MRLVPVLLSALVLGVTAIGCSSESPVADAAVEEDGSSVNPDQSATIASQEPPANDFASTTENPSLDESSCGVSSTVVRSVRDVYAVLAPDIVDKYVVIDYEILAAYSHVRFAVNFDAKDYEFFGYMVEGVLHVRAAVCPCCGQVGLAHGGTCLSCHSCGTTFSLVDSAGDGEDCGFPVGEVPYENGESCVRFLADDLAEAYERTAAGEAELFEPEPEPVENEADDTSWPRCCRR